MKTIAVIVTLLVALFCCGNCLADQEDSVGVAYSTGNNLVCYDLATKEKTSLLANNEQVPAGPFSVSEDGTRAVFLFENRIYVKSLPVGKAVYLKWAGKTKGRAFVEGPDFLVNGVQNLNYPLQKGTGISGRSFFSNNAKSLQISPNGKTLSCEVEGTGVSYPRSSSGQGCVKTIDTCNHVLVMEVEGGNVVQNFAHISKFGNLAVFSGLPFVDKETGSIKQITSTPNYGCSGLTLTPADALQRFSFKRNAFFGAFSKDGNLFAVIYQTPNGWGPIEIRDLRVMLPPLYLGRNQYHSKVTGVYEIPVQLPNCQGLAWKPDGSLTCLSGGRLVSFNGKQMAQAIQGSGWAPNPDPSCYVPVPVNNILQVTPALVAQGVAGYKVYWSSDACFFYRGSDRGIYRWKSGVTQKVTDNSPNEYSYVNTSGSSPSTQETQGSVTWYKSRADDLSQGRHQGHFNYFYAGEFKLSWSSVGSDKEYILNTLVPGQKGLDYYILAKTVDISKIDLSSCRFQSGGQLKRGRKPQLDNYGCIPLKNIEGGSGGARCPVESIVLLKLDEVCVALRVTKIEFKNFEVSNSGTITYEWAPLLPKGAEKNNQRVAIRR